ncbi:pre-rRNA-processing protein TSR1 homolog [Trichonephila inaurata madagascariensis]|uniref:Pre-rRNA-processing protein TSR1 homolog n=1 Tax=Trichonephila inaurata madagascariensis TaxID=2747483 RepID=A0A8X6YL10_9ARAC|nr:pre-rRNA-processing protein TSR1 homolog [Trichonephila inaurata madagascariensis]
MPLPTQEVHRHGPLKQSNKAHKGEKGSRQKHKGRCVVKTISRKKFDLKRADRKNQMNQLRKAKREKVLQQKRNLGGLKSVPMLVMILSLDDSISPTEFLDKLQSCDEDLVVSETALGHTHISCYRFKQRYTFIIPNKSDLHSVLDALKVCETLLLLHSPNAHDENTEWLLSVMMAHALPTTVHVVQGFDKMNPKKKAGCRKQISKAIESRFPDVKLYQADTNQELLLLLRQIGSQKQQSVGFRDNRPHLLVENISFDLKDTVSNKGILKVSGYVRGQPLNVNGLVHIPGWDTFQMNQIDSTSDPYSEQKFTMILGTSETANPLDQESLQSEVIPDPLDQEQTWPTQEELDAADLMKPKKAVRKVIEGTSEYQSTWIEDENEGCEISDEESCNNSQMMSDNESEEIEETMDVTDSVSVTDDIKDDNYDDNLDMDEEKQMLVKFKEERMNIMFPDEQDTPVDVKAYVRYQKYRGLKNFRSSPWDPMENLPLDYARIYRFQNFRQTKKKVLKSEKEGVEPGEYVNVYINDVPQSLYDSVNTEKTVFILYGLLPHEQKMSVVNAVIRKHPSCKVPIKSKDTLIFHVGFRRFTCKPIFSEHKTGIKYKFERFLPSDAAVVASFYAPVTFPPVSVVVFRQTRNGSHQLVATGSIMNVDPNRVVVKRIVLSGHPFRIFKRSAVVRYMFFNRDDINYFKCIELQTKLGRRGHIREPLGSHGHMKCVFDKQLNSQDVALMFLYKRVFPKWTFDNYVPSPVIEELSA